MAITVTHTFVSPVVDEAIADEVGPSEWNANHTIVGSIAASEVTGTGDLTKADDVNVTLTLGGTPTGALLRATSITVGWSGTLAASRGGWGANISAQSGIPILTTGVAAFFAPAAGIQTFLTTPSSANLATAVTDETGTGLLVFATNPVLTTPNLGTPSAVVLTNATGLPTAGLVNDAVTYAKIQNVSAASRILGRGSAAGSGDVEEITLGTGLTMTGTSLSSSGSGRELLTAVRTYYVRTDGADTNTGLADTAGGAFLTIQKAINTVHTIDNGGFAVTIQVRSGTYTAGASVIGAFVGSGVTTLVGDTTTPANVIISNATNCIALSGRALMSVGGFKLTTSAGSGIAVAGGSVCNVTGAMEYGAAPTASLFASEASTITVTANYTVSGGGAYHMIAEQLSGIVATGRSVTVSGTPAFSQAFLWLQNIGFAYNSGTTFTGAATGQRYNIAQNSVANTAGGGANFYPGNVAGAAATGAQYI